MGMLSPHRRFVDPGNTEGIPKVHPRNPHPDRSKPLLGTKSMRTPHDGSMEEMLHRKADSQMPTRAAHVMGWLAVAGVVGVWIILWIAWRETDLRLRFRGNASGTMIVAVAGIHLLAIFSQIISGGRNLPGALSILLLYGGTLLLAVIDHLTR